MYAQQLGWLHAKPGDSDMTRLELYGGKWYDWPEDLGPVQYLITAAQNMRFGTPSENGGFLPQLWTDVVSFGREVAGLTERWELSALMDMSQEYVSERVNGTNALRTSPMDRWRREQDGG